MILDILVDKQPILQCLLLDTKSYTQWSENQDGTGKAL